MMSYTQWLCYALDQRITVGFPADAVGTCLLQGNQTSSGTTQPLIKWESRFPSQAVKQEGCDAGTTFVNVIYTKSRLQSVKVLGMKPFIVKEKNNSAA